MKYEIKGTIMQFVEITLDAGEAVFTESGGMSWSDQNIDMETNTRGGLMAGLGRALAGESLFMSTYTSRANGARIGFATCSPGKIVDVRLGAGQSLICQKEAFLVAEPSVKLEVQFRRKLGVGLFGGEGFVLQKLTGPGMAFLEISGELYERNLQPGEVLKVDTGHVAMFEPSVQYDITTVKGFKNALFGGEGLFLAALRGPGRVWLQTMPVVNLAQEIYKYLPKSSS